MEKLDKTWELKENCHFVDAYDLDHARQKPKEPRNRLKPEQEIQVSYVMKNGDGSGKDCTYLKLNDIAGFIGRFVVMGVPEDTIAQIVRSEYDNLPGTPTPEEMVTAVVKMLGDFGSIQPRTIKPDYKEPPKESGTATHKCQYKLDFKVNPIGIGIFKG